MNINDLFEKVKNPNASAWMQERQSLLEEMGRNTAGSAENWQLFGQVKDCENRILEEYIKENLI